MGVVVVVFCFAKADVSDCELSAHELIELDRLMFLGQRPDGLIVRHAVHLARRIAHKTVLRYSWIDEDDLQQNLLLGLPRFLDRYRPNDKSKTAWSKNLYFRFIFFVKDILRREDPLGIRWPQRQHYPSWFRLGGDSAGVFDGGGTGIALVGSDCPPELLAGLFETVDGEPENDDEIWLQDFAAFCDFAEKQRESDEYKRARQSIDLGAGRLVCPRNRDWDKRRCRVKFRAKPANRISHWRRARFAAKRRVLAAMS